MTREEIDQLVARIRPRPTPAWAADYPMRDIPAGFQLFPADRHHYGPVNLTPPFQRGHVWTKEQQLRFCESLIRGLIPRHLLTFQFNCPYWDVADVYTGDLPREIQCIDGLQRITAIDKMRLGQILPFGVHADVFDSTRLTMHCATRCVRVEIHRFLTKRELLQYYLDLNEGATPHTAEELERVRSLIR
jgi:hypothetical protein